MFRFREVEKRFDQETNLTYGYQKIKPTYVPAFFADLPAGDDDPDRPVATIEEAKKFANDLLDNIKK